MKHLLLAMVVCAVAGRAAADSVPTRARTLAERGRAAHDARDYAGAIAAFTEAYAIAPAPALLFNLAQAYRLAGRCDDASLMYRRFLASSPSDDARGLAELHLATVERCAQAQPPRLTLLPATIDLPHLAQAPVPEGRDHKNLRTAGLGVAVGGGLALVIAGVYAVKAHDASSEVERRYADGENYRQLAALDAEGHRDATVAKIAVATGIVAAVAATTMLIVDHRRHHRTKLDITPGMHGGKVSVAWRF